MQLGETRMRQDDYYQLLGVGRGASHEEVKRAFRTRIQAVHPDHCPGDTLANDSARKLIEAYRTLTDPLRRKCYDHSLPPLVQPMFVPRVATAGPPTCYPRVSRAFAILLSIVLIISSALLLAQLILADPRPDYGTFGSYASPADETQVGRVGLLHSADHTPSAFMRKATDFTIPPSAKHGPVLISSH